MRLPYYFEQLKGCPRLLVNLWLALPLCEVVLNPEQYSRLIPPQPLERQPMPDYTVLYKSIPGAHDRSHASTEKPPWSPRMFFFSRAVQGITGTGHTQSPRPESSLPGHLGSPSLRFFTQTPDEVGSFSFLP